jgi:hypothetical protein
MRENTPLLPGLSPVSGKCVEACFNGGSLSSDARVLALREIDMRLQVAARLAACITDTRQPERVRHNFADIIRFRLLMIACGYEDQPMTASVPDTARAVRLYRVVNDQAVACEAVQLAGGAAAIDTVLRRAMISGRVEIGGPLQDHFADLLDSGGDIVETVALDRASYSALKDRWMRCRLARA